MTIDTISHNAINRATEQKSPKDVSVTHYKCINKKGRLTRSIIPPKLQKRIQAVRNKHKSKHRARATSPLRMTSCIFKSPMTRITAHPENTTRRNKQEETLEKPQQLCIFRRLQEYHIEDGTGNLLGPLCLSNPTKRTARRLRAGTMVASGVNGLHTSRFTSVQSPSCCHLNLQQVTAADIRRQSRRVARARKRLAEALELDRLARQEENMEA
ncbi:methyl-CpG-binding domain protein 3-like 2B [Microtus oregoni]|uniref:methyl-CpG-binding domain protein 3-like 2B n=1 Tax=Microtus oregoni TaxID=111838 RepID=UPI001BB21271|nr:methyl-CpG-binding domain protein 3-like 2B [Microtus oregoni]